MKRFSIPLAFVLLTLASCSVSQESTSSSGEAGTPIVDTTPASIDRPKSPDTSDYPDRTIQPNVQFPVVAESGTCPETVAVWEFLLGFEGGADHTVVADFGAIATLPVEVVQSEAQRVVYEAPLNEEFATCVGTARSEYLSMYAFEFGEGKVRFDLDLTNSDGFREIRYADVSVNRPYVYWRAAE